MECTWTVIKGFVNTYSLALQWVDLGNLYYIKAHEGSIDAECYLMKDGSADQTDFETNYKTLGNQKAVAALNPAFAAKTYLDKDLYKRITGIQQNLVQGSNTITFSITYAWVKITGIEVIGGESLDTVSMEILDSPTGQYSGTANYVLNQFGFSVNINAGYYKYDSEYDADLYQNMQIQLTYTSKSAKTIGINFIINEVK